MGNLGRPILGEYDWTGSDISGCIYRHPGKCILFTGPEWGCWIAFNFAYENLAQQKTNMRAALGRMIDVDIAEESTNLATYNVLSQAAASMIAQANATSDLALILLR